MEEQQAQGIFKMPVQPQPVATQPSNPGVPTMPQPKQDFGIGPEKEKGPSDAAVMNFNKAAGTGKDVSAELEEEERFSDEDISMAEQVLFQGWAVANMPMLGGKHKATITTSVPIEFELVEEALDKFVVDQRKAWETANPGKPFAGLPGTVVSSKNKLLTLASYFKGFNDQDLCKDMNLRLETIKAGIERLRQSASSGDLVEVQKIKPVLIEMLWRRAEYISGMVNTVVIDNIVAQKNNFEIKMDAIMSSKAIYPKS